MNHDWLVMQFEGPLVAFGGIAMDHVRPTWDFPAASMVTGLIGNALGWHWCDTDRHQNLQDRLVFAVYKHRRGFLLTDMQNAEMNREDEGWTTWERPEGRTGANRTYDSPHRRKREYHADASARLVLRLRQAGEAPTIAALIQAFHFPARPLFIGRKPCLPSRPLVAANADRCVEAASAYDALCAVASRNPSTTRKQALWPVGEGPQHGASVDRIVERRDLRNWRKGVHAGSRPIVEGWVP